MSFQIKVPRPAADKKKSWKEILVDHIRDGKALPIVGNGFTDDLAFRNHQGLVAGWADYMDYPFVGEGHSLP
ncbi:MAG: hypothetical protein HYR94_08330, partial [Chloroflexi bacterium]|nr:hypothetical protein [Chloroflexota bacterium]